MDVGGADPGGIASPAARQQATRIAARRGVYPGSAAAPVSPAAAATIRWSCSPSTWPARVAS
jgi:hypothetical protein